MKRDNLIFDVGMYHGEDTAQYLSRGFDVVGVEANPALVTEIEQRFANEIAAGRLTVIGAAVATEPGIISFPVNYDEAAWSSLDPRFISRNEDVLGTRHRTVEVPAVRFEDLLAEYGVPHYLKVDIEGSDMLCVRALHGARERPDYLSLETVATAPGTGLMPILDELAELSMLGYRWFKFIDQAPLWKATGQFVSGPFGEDTPGRWMSVRSALARVAVIRVQYQLGGSGGRWTATAAGRAFQQIQGGLLKRTPPWYDLHVKLGDVPDRGPQVEAGGLLSPVDYPEPGLNQLRDALRVSDEELRLHREWLEGIQSSASWRLTAPLRAVKRNVKRTSPRRSDSSQ